MAFNSNDALELVKTVGAVARKSQALLDDCRRVLGPDHPDTVRIRANLAFWLDRAQGT